MFDLFPVLREKRASLSSGGFTMVEMIATIAVLSFGIIAIYSAFYPLVVLNYNIPLRLTAVYLTQEGLEIIHNMRDRNFIQSVQDGNSNWSDDLLDCETGCQADYKTGTMAEELANQLQPYNENAFLKLNEDGFYGYGNGTATRFRRKITVGHISQDTLKVNVEVIWEYNGQPFSFQASQYLYNWN